MANGDASNPCTTLFVIQAYENLKAICGRRNCPAAGGFLAFVRDKRIKLLPLAEKSFREIAIGLIVRL